MPGKLKLEPGGRWFPKHCASWQRVAVIVPYRNRETQLQIFLQNMHPFLQSQQLDYGIFVIEQVQNSQFLIEHILYGEMYDNKYVNSTMNFLYRKTS